MVDPDLPVRVARGLPHRPSFAEALTWLEIFGDAPEAIDRWKTARLHRHQHVPEDAAPHEGATDAAPTPTRRRRRRRRGRRHHGPAEAK
jgi:hypothetical protein